RGTGLERICVHEDRAVHTLQHFGVIDLNLTDHSPATDWIYSLPRIQRNTVIEVRCAYGLLNFAADVESARVTFAGMPARVTWACRRPQVTVVRIHLPPCQARRWINDPVRRLRIRRSCPRAHRPERGRKNGYNPIKVFSCFGHAEASSNNECGKMAGGSD